MHPTLSSFAALALQQYIPGSCGVQRVRDRDRFMCATVCGGMFSVGLPTAQSMPVVETTHFYWSISENMNDYRARKERVFTTTMSIGPRGRNHPEIRIALTGLSRFVYVISGSKHTGSSSRTAQQRQQQQEQQPTRQSKLSDEVRLQTLRRRSSLRRSTNNINLQRGSSSKEKGQPLFARPSCK